MTGFLKFIASMLIGASVPTLSLAADQPAPAAPVALTAADAPAQANGKMICKREATTGSFVKSRKVCRSLAEWNRLAEFTRNEMREYVDHGRGGSNGR